MKFLYEDNPKPWHECQVLLRPIAHTFATNQIRSDNRKITSHDLKENFKSIFVDFISNNASGRRKDRLRTVNRLFFLSLSALQCRYGVSVLERFARLFSPHINWALSMENMSSSISIPFSLKRSESLEYGIERWSFFFSTDEKSVAVRQPWLDPTEMNSSINDYARRAFETVLYVRQRLYASDRFRRFAASVVDFARESNRTKQLTHESVRISTKSSFLLEMIRTSTIVLSLFSCIELVHHSE